MICKPTSIGPMRRRPRATTGLTESAPGDYQVIVEARGFAKRIINAHVTQDQVASVNVALALAGASTSLTVTVGVAQELDPDETRLQTTLESEQIENLPLQNGSPLEVVRIAPGVTGIDEDRSLSAASIEGNTMNAQANGRTNTGNSYQLDGVSIQNNTGSAGDPTQNHAITFMPTEDMVQEVALEVNTYAVDYGSGSSMRVNMTTKGGTNKFHGDFGDRYSGPRPECDRRLCRSRDPQLPPLVHRKRRRPDLEG
jgi:hypothetical protein